MISDRWIWRALHSVGDLDSLIVVAGAVACAILALWWAHRRRLRNFDPEPRCGQCGYAVRENTTLTCPECGSDLREVGIIKPDRATRLGSDRKSGVARFARRCATATKQKSRLREKFSWGFSARI